MGIIDATGDAPAEHLKRKTTMNPHRLRDEGMTSQFLHLMSEAETYRTVVSLPSGDSTDYEASLEQLDIGYSRPVGELPMDILAARVGQKWAHLVAAQEFAIGEQRKLESALTEFASADSSIVVFGSLGRHEFTPGSDIDWTLLVDGMADPAHWDTALEIRRRLKDLGHTPPGREGVFGHLAFSHNLIHQIGGEDDTNSNTTRRILLLVESDVIGRRDAHKRTVLNVLHRYLNEDRGLWYGSGEFRVPRFLLNDIVRYWRTMAFDFAYKQRARGFCAAQHKASHLKEAHFYFRFACVL